MADALVRDPIYQQLNRALRGLIRGREFKQGDRFLSERAIAERFRVSRATANKALSNLVSEGILAFKKGVGTFVQGGVLDYDLRALVSYTDKARAAGKRPSTRVLAFHSLPASEADAGVADGLRPGPGDTLYYMERLRLADGVPVILERRHVAAKLCPGLRERDLRGSLYALWTDRYGLDLARADQTIRSVSIGSADAKRLGIRRGRAGLLSVATGYLGDETPLWFERTLYRGDAYEFHNRLGRIRTARPAAGVLRTADR